jgi:multisubunit Na+/H+ antiporter MnhG subunit
LFLTANLLLHHVSKLNTTSVLAILILVTMETAIRGNHSLIEALKTAVQICVTSPRRVSALLAKAGHEDPLLM